MEASRWPRLEAHGLFTHTPPDVARTQKVVLDADAIQRSIRRIAVAILEATSGIEDLTLIGIRRGGVGLSKRIAEEIANVEGRPPPVGTVDISLYRDDAATALPNPKIGPSDIPFDVSGRHVVLVDDVLHTGRTVRAAIECLQDHGRPARVWLAALCDRGGRELPIAPDFVGRILDLEPGGRLDVWVDAAGPDRVVLTEGE
ncbi:MAG: bifunctional pyr operon transcriptional regulator/uracil phosphoribosyltransferase PyrR [Deltaproteobacteria bacterium]|nr:bifunctional pyr operon transcriptional regulator/uracil phosphoribosyltransferase PyrR [Deltaproteobacteria bacterium]NND28663.1 bifunctional pyr operon transcriptional regulator/uracil phosphoribosyltransferase PyrR [Myxococcales bacterium]MBT8466497.1 bifunctional pyr operon transcriptional regulator/uracil phosphoribosyltransferase PyrR [Deltaproteobacteria bacterium]MBT8481871.1 bifunctional pyr operon transcriptional regulator/uracil phosphoribosyltransferase PyrR [Deltaproteobacteria b